MIRSNHTPAPEALPLEDVIAGIVRLPLPIQERIGLLRTLYDVTEKVENGMCVIEGPFREKLHELFTNRHREVTERLQTIRARKAQTARESQALAGRPLEAAEEEELARIVEETRGDFDALEQKLSSFEQQTRVAMEKDVRRKVDEGDMRSIYDQLKNPPLN